MTPANYAKVKEVFAAAIELPEEQRTEFVKQQGAGEDDTVREVLSLLRHHSDDTLLDDRVDKSQQTIAASPSQIVDPFLVLREVWEDSRHVLRRRLIVISSVLAALIAISTVRLLTYHYAEWGYGARVLGFIFCALAAVILHYRRDLTIVQIRMAEFLVMGTVGLLVIVIDVRLMLEYGAALDEATLISVTHWHYFSWTLLIFIYGVFMPNTWQRAAAVLLPVAAIPAVVTQTVASLDTNVALLLDEDRFGAAAANAVRCCVRRHLCGPPDSRCTTVRIAGRVSWRNIASSG